jgi:hypothetical protein
MVMQEMQALCPRKNDKNAGDTGSIKITVDLFSQG